MSGQRFDIRKLAKFYRGKRIAIIGNGPSVVFTNQRGERVGKADFSQYPHPMWTVNGGWYYHPNTALGFQMDDIKGISIAQHPTPDWYLSLIRNAQIPIITAKEYEDFPCTVSYPLKDVISFFGVAYFTDSVAYMIALATMMGVKEIDFFGADYATAPAHERAGAEYWCGTARMLGVQLNVAPQSALLKPVISESYYMPGFYGYSREAFPLEWQGNANESVNIKMNGPLLSLEARRKLFDSLPNPMFPKADKKTKAA